METSSVISGANDTNGDFIFCSRRTYVSAEPFSRDWSAATRATPRSVSWTLSNLTPVDAAELRGQWWKFSSERVSALNRYLEGRDTEISRILSQMLVWSSEITVFRRCLVQGHLPMLAFVEGELGSELFHQSKSRKGLRTVLFGFVQSPFLALAGGCSLRLFYGNCGWNLWML